MNSRLFVTALASFGATVMSAGSVAAQSRGGWFSNWWGNWFNWGGWSHGTGPTSSAVPEIDASTGGLAIAAIAAGLLLMREIRRRRKAR
ncbi:VPEID-CTERM sorting domain-containing protein [Cribrihabitans marinus]|nr:VPEID-CTERM sorting domain-containing protein [Cribrihabitans marinus]